jgi:hypothetical protein
MVILGHRRAARRGAGLRALMEAGAVRRPRGLPRIRPAAVAGDKGYSRKDTANMSSLPSTARMVRRAVDGP